MRYVMPLLILAAPTLVLLGGAFVVFVTLVVMDAIARGRLP